VLYFFFGDDILEVTELLFEADRKNRIFRHNKVSLHYKDMSILPVRISPPQMERIRIRLKRYDAMTNTVCELTNFRILRTTVM